MDIAFDRTVYTSHRPLDGRVNYQIEVGDAVWTMLVENGVAYAVETREHTSPRVWEFAILIVLGRN